VSNVLQNGAIGDSSDMAMSSNSIR
jgi:hypothetical protein